MRGYVGIAAGVAIVALAIKAFLGGGAKAADIVVAPGGDIQAALDQGGHIYVPRGEYNISQTLVVQRPSTFLELSNNAILMANGGIANPMITAAGPNVSDVEVKGGKWLQFTTGVVGTCFDLSDVPVCVIAPNRIENFDLAFRMFDTANNSFYNLIENCIVFNCHSILDVGGTRANFNLVQNIRGRPVPGGNKPATRLVDARGWHFNQYNVEPADPTGIVGVYLDPTTRETLFSNPWIENCEVGMHIDGATRTTIEAGTITGSSLQDFIDNGIDTRITNLNLAGVTINK